MPRRLEASARRERGAIIAEFAIIALVVWVLLAGTLELGRAFAAQHLLQNAARATARALSLGAFAEDATFEAALAQGLFDEGFLVFDEELLARCGVPGFGDPEHAQRFEDFLRDDVPRLNRLLRPLMIFEATQGASRLRYPGTVVLRDPPPGGFVGCASGSRYTVLVLVLGEEPIWLPVVEEYPEDGFPRLGGGWSSLRIHYPFQAAALVSWVETGVTNPRTGRSFQLPEEVAAPDVTAPDGTQLDPSLGGVSASPSLVNPYSGSLGLGRVYMLGKEVRPYRRVLSASAAFRREVFL